jgi:DNA uptake protein ComE-like DNA-binding protein
MNSAEQALPSGHRRIQTRMKKMLLGTIALLGLAGCNTTQSNPTPDQIRENTAKATSEVVRDTKAVAKGIADGVKQQAGKDHLMDINKASADDLKTLPGVDDAHAQKIIDGRPYNDTSDLVKKHVVSGTEYDRISDKIAAR